MVTEKQKNKETRFGIFEKVYMEKHNGDILNMFDWILGSKSNLKEKEKYEHFVHDFICWCNISGRLSHA